MVPRRSDRMRLLELTEIVAPGAGRHRLLTAGRALFAVAILVASLWRAVGHYLGLLDAGGGPFQTGDWLINYTDGPVRRGLAGTLLLWPRLSAAATLDLMLVLQSACYVLLAAYLLRHMARSGFSWMSIVLACAPSSLPFIGLDPLGAYRKELLLLTSLVLLAWSVSQRDRHRSRALLLTAAALLIYTLAVFSWEASVVALPAIWHLLRAGLTSDQRSPVPRSDRAAFLAAAWVAGLVASLGLALSFFSPGDLGTAKAICADLSDRGFRVDHVCGGAIDWLGHRIAQDVALVVERLPESWIYVPSAVLASLPLLSSGWVGRNRRTVAAIAIAALPLFVVAVDYGRWISLIYLEVAICAAAGGTAHTRRWSALTAVPFLTAWGFTHVARVWNPFCSWITLIARWALQAVTALSA